MDYAATLAKPAELVGLTVADSSSSMQGEVSRWSARWRSIATG